MTLQASGPISLADINVELGQASNTRISLNGTLARNLADIPSGPISLADFYGKANYDASVMVLASTLSASSNEGSAATIIWGSQITRTVGGTGTASDIISSGALSDYNVTLWIDPTQGHFGNVTITGIPNNNLLSQAATTGFTVALMPIITGPSTSVTTTINGIITLKHIVTGTLKVCSFDMTGLGSL
jgi:hypothetical protein